MKKFLFISIVLTANIHFLYPSTLFPEPTFQDNTKNQKTLEQKAYLAYLALIRSPNYQHADPEEQYQMIDALAHPFDMTIEQFRRIIDEAEENKK